MSANIANIKISDETFSNPVRMQVKILWTLVAIFLAGLLISLALESTSSALMFALLGGLTVLVAIIGTLWSRSVDRRLAAFREGDYHTCWIYSNDDCQRFANLEKQRIKTLGFPVATFVFGLIGAGVGLAAFNGAIPMLGAGLPAFLFVSAIGVSLGLICDNIVSLIAKRRVQRLAKGFSSTYISHEGLYVDGMFEPWNSYYQSLVDVKLIDGELAVLELVFRQHGGRHSSMRTRRVPVPARRRKEANSIAAALQDQWKPTTADDSKTSNGQSISLLADWNYDPQELDQYARQVYWSELKVGAALLVTLLMIGLFLGALLGVPLWLITGRVILLTACEIAGTGFFLFGGMVMVLFVSWPDARKQYQKITNSNGVARFTQEGVSFAGEYWSWRVQGRKNTKIEIKPGSPAVFSFEYYSLVGEYILANVPVPTGREVEAEQLAATLTLSSSGSQSDEPIA